MTNFPGDAVRDKHGVQLEEGDNVVGSLAGNLSFVDVTLTLDTAAYASGDVLADTQVITNAMRVKDRTGKLESIVVIDEDDAKQGIDFVFLSANVSLGAENGVPAITDINSRQILGIVAIASGDFNDLGGTSVASKTGINLNVKPAAGTRDVYVAAISKGTGTYTANGVKLRLSFRQD